MATASPAPDGQAADAATSTGRRVRGAGAEPVWTVLGRRVHAPVEVRRAAQWSVQYLVAARDAQRIVAPTGLEVTGPVPGRALVALAVCRYDDTDLDPYHEVAVSFLVRAHDSEPRASAFRRLAELVTGSVGVYIHRLPVDREFSCAAGRDIWGFPKWVASIEIDEPAGSAGAGTAMSARLVDAGAHVLTLSVEARGPLRLPSSSPPTYSFTDGILRRTTWTTAADGVTGRIGGARLTLGDHPMADELRSLGLPKRAVLSSASTRMRASFDAAEMIDPTRVVDRDRGRP